MTTGRINQGARGLAVGHTTSRAPRILFTERPARAALGPWSVRAARRRARFLQSVFFPSRARGGPPLPPPAFGRSTFFFVQTFSAESPGGRPAAGLPGRSTASFRRDALDFLRSTRVLSRRRAAGKPLTDFPARSTRHTAGEARPPKASPAGFLRQDAGFSFIQLYVPLFAQPSSTFLFFLHDPALRSYRVRRAS